MAPHYFLAWRLDLPKVLVAAGIERARDIILALPGDGDNLLVAVTCKDLNPAARLIARVSMSLRREEFGKTAGGADDLKGQLPDDGDGDFTSY